VLVLLILQVLASTSSSSVRVPSSLRDAAMPGRPGWRGGGGGGGFCSIKLLLRNKTIDVLMLKERKKMPIAPENVLASCTGCPNEDRSHKRAACQPAYLHRYPSVLQACCASYCFVKAVQALMFSSVLRCATVYFSLFCLTFVSQVHVGSAFAVFRVTPCKIDGRLLRPAEGKFNSCSIS
jgi:hypothetical protein